MRKMIFVDSRYDSFYGAQKSMVTLIRTLAGQWECRVLVTADGLLKKELERIPIKTDLLKLGNLANALGGKVLTYSVFQKLVVYFQILLWNLRLIPYLLKHRIDLVYVNDQRAFLYAFPAAKVLRKKIVYYVRTDLEESFFTRLSFCFSDGIITIAKGVLRRLPASFVMKYRRKMVNIYTGFDFHEVAIIPKKEAKARIGVDEGRFAVGYVGSLNPRKGLDLLVKALQDLPEKDRMTLVISGTISSGYEAYWRRLEEAIHQNGISFRYLGYRSEMSLVYRAFDLLILPSRSEGLPRTVIEAMAHEVPVIATDVGGVREIIDRPEVGVVISPDSVGTLREAITSLLSGDDRRESMGIEGRRQALERFGIERYRMEIRRFFDGLMQGPLGRDDGYGYALYARKDREDGR